MERTFKFGALLAFFTLRFVVASSFPETDIPKSTKLALRLIHRHSILSHYTKQKINNGRYSLSLDDDIRAPVAPKEDRSLFLVNISIGEPPSPHLLAMDTGSSLTWVRCIPCDEPNVSNNAFFDREKSSTYYELSSLSPRCTNFMYGFQEHQSQCSYTIRYADQSTSSGVMALEKFTFLTSTGGTVQVPDVVFGCALSIGGDARDLNGILGLEAPSKYHFVARNHNKFSYCIGSIHDAGYMYNQLILGDGAIIQGDSTPIQSNKDHHYVVSLEGISIGEKQLTINPYEFYYNVILDSGTTLTTLKKSAYEPLLAEVKSLMDGILTSAAVNNVGNQLCYKGNLERDLKGFPAVTFRLAEGAEIDLDVDGLFYARDRSTFCMGIVKSEDNLIGVMAQQYYNVGFDLDAMRVSFQRMDCELLED